MNLRYRLGRRIGEDRIGNEISKLSPQNARELYQKVNWNGLSSPLDIGHGGSRQLHSARQLGLRNFRRDPSVANALTKLLIEQALRSGHLHCF